MGKNARKKRIKEENTARQDKRNIDGKTRRTLRTEGKQSDPPVANSGTSAHNTTPAGLGQIPLQGLYCRPLRS